MCHIPQNLYVRSEYYSYGYILSTSISVQAKQTSCATRKERIVITLQCELLGRHVTANHRCARLLINPSVGNDNNMFPHKTDLRSSANFSQVAKKTTVQQKI